MPQDKASSKRRALIVGGSMSGLLAGLALRRAGWDVEVYERVEAELSARGAGIVAQPELIAILRQLGLDTRALGVEITQRRIFDAQGRLVLEAERAQTLTAWERLYRLLYQAFGPKQYHRGKALAGLQQGTAGVVAHFADGSVAAGDLLIGADGLRSTVRGHCLPALTPLYAGYVAWRDLVAEAMIPPAAHAELFEAMAFCLPAGEQFLTYPIAGPNNDLRRGRRRLNVVWYRPAAEATELRDLLTDRTGITHAISIPPPLIRPAAIAAMRAAAERLIAPTMRSIVRLMREPILQPIYDLETPQMAFGRVAIMGDAAFVARPHVGAGVSKAAEDALSLAAALARPGGGGERGPAPLRGRAAAGRAAHHPAGPASGGLSAGKPCQRRRAGAVGPLQHGRRGDRRNRGARFPVSICAGDARRDQKFQR